MDARPSIRGGSVSRQGTAADLVDRLQRRAPEYLDLISAETDAAFERAFDSILEKTIVRLEENGVNVRTLDEVGLSAFLAAGLSMPGISVAQERHSNGHVDLVIEASSCFPVRKKLAEAKIYDGPKYHIQGLEQLLDRYSTGREGRGLIISYVRKRGIARVVKRLREVMDDERPLRQEGPTVDHSMKWSFLSQHHHSSGELVGVGHVSCNLFVGTAGPDDELVKAVTSR